MKRYVCQLCVCMAVVACAPPLPASAQGTDATSPGLSTLSTATEMDAEREKIWNSPEMLEARARVELTLKRSAKVTDAQAAQYMAELKAKSPDQMKIWLIQQQELSAQRQQEESRAAQLRRQRIGQTLPAQTVGSFRNPVAATGRPVGSSARPAPRQNTVQRTQRPFSGPEFSAASQPLVTSQDMARFEILRGNRPW